MEIKFNNVSILDKKDGLSNSKGKIINLECQSCSNYNDDFKLRESCIKCLLEMIKKYRKLKISTIYMVNQNFEIKPDYIGDLKSFFLNQNKILKLWNKVNSFRKCDYKQFECKMIESLKFRVMDLENWIDDPLKFYDEISDLKQEIQKIINSDPNCIECIKIMELNLEKIVRLFENMQIFKDYDNQIREGKNLKKISSFYNKIFCNKNSYLLKRKREIKQNLQKITNYIIGENEEFRINIYKVKYESEKFYDSRFNVSSKLNENYISNLIKDIGESFNSLKMDKILPFEDILEIYKNQALDYIKKKYQFSSKEENKLALLAAIKRVKLIKLFPLLVDDYVEEIFLDSPKEKLYLNHQKFGRCRTNISLNPNEIERLKTFLRIYSSKRLDYSFPSNKLVIKNKYFYCRFAVDVSPLALNKFAIDIRKLNKNVMTIQDLLQNETLNPRMAAFLYFNVLRRVNITVTGETNTGKTTLINALDFISPKKLRKIYVENVDESLNQISYGRHQLKFRVDSINNPDIKFSKGNQIKTLLHRTPDIIYLGEILTIDEAKAMFHCLAAGLRGFQTIHANDIESLINRFLYHFNIHLSCLDDLDLILLMKNIQNQRRIVSISEIKSKNIEINPIYSFNPQNNKYELNLDLYESTVIQKLKRFENLNKEYFYYILSIYEDLFTTLKVIRKLGNKELVELFDIISYFSISSPYELEKIWFQWKKRNLKP